MVCCKWAKCLQS